MVYFFYRNDHYKRVKNSHVDSVTPYPLWLQFYITSWLAEGLHDKITSQGLGSHKLNVGIRHPLQTTGILIWSQPVRGYMVFKIPDPFCPPARQKTNSKILNSKKLSWLDHIILWLYQLSWKCKLATVTSYKADVSSVRPSSERMTNVSLWRRANARNVSFITRYGGQFTFST